MTSKKIHNISEICARLRQIRVELAGPRGKSSFAKMLGISASTYDYYEAGRIPPVELVVKVAEVADVDLYWLLTGKASTNAPGYDNPIVRRAVRLLKKYPQATQQLSAFLDILSDALQLGDSAATAEEPAELQDLPDDTPQPSSAKDACPNAWIPVLGRSAAGISHFWAEDEDTKNLTSINSLIEKYMESVEKEKIPALRNKINCPKELGGKVELITLKDPAGPAQSVEFVSSEALREKYGDALALRIDGDSMDPEISHGDIVVISPSVKAKPGDIAVVQLEDAIGVTCKIYHPEGEKVNLVAINEKYPPQKQPAKDVNWALKVVAKIRPEDKK